MAGITSQKAVITFR